MSDEAVALGEWFRRLVERHDRETEALDTAYQEFMNAGLIGKVVVQRYICERKGCKLATVISVGGRLICRAEPYKLGRGLNQVRSVESARAKNTLDGERHWPGPTFDVREWSDWGPSMAVGLNCRCKTRSLSAARILADASGKAPGHPGAPSRI